MGMTKRLEQWKLVHQAPAQLVTVHQTEKNILCGCWSAHVKTGYNYKQLPVQLTQTQSQIIELEEEKKESNEKIYKM